MSEQKITPCLWFDSNAEEAVAHYLSIFANSRILSTTRYGDFAPDRQGEVLTVLFEINGQRLLALNGGPHYKFTPALSLIVNCDDQAEIDVLWGKLAQGGEHVQCGWLTDKFGVSWQIVPRNLPELLGGDAEQTDRVMRAVMSMKKLEIKNYDAGAFVDGLKARGIEPHVAINGTVSKHGKIRKTAVPPEVAASLGYAISQRLRKRIEEGFGWGKTVGGLTQLKVRGLDKVRTVFVFAIAAYNIVRLPKLLAPRGEVRPATRLAT